MGARKSAVRSARSSAAQGYSGRHGQTPVNPALSQCSEHDWLIRTENWPISNHETGAMRADRTPKLSRFWRLLARSTSGNAMLFVALGLPALIGGAGLAVDFSQW